MSYREELNDFLDRFPYQTMRVGEAVFRYIIAGNKDNPCVIFLNGGMNCSEMWFKYVEQMSVEYRTLIFDYPYELKDCDSTAASMNELFLRLGINKAFFVGASFGGLMAQIFTRKYPEMVTGLGLFSTAGLDENTICGSKKKYCLLPLMLWYMKRCNYEKLKPKLISSSMKNYAKDESPEDKQYLQEMFECMFKDYNKEKDIHITSMMAKLVDMKPCEPSDFNFIRDKVLLIFPEKDFFSKKEQASLDRLFPQARIEYVKNGHFGTVIETDKYIRLLKEII